MGYDKFIAELEAQLEKTGCSIWRDLEFPPDWQVPILATRLEFNIIRVPVHMCVSYVSSPTGDDFVKLFEQGLIFSKRAFSEPKDTSLLFSSYAIIPCLACEVASPETIKFVTTYHPFLKEIFKYWDHGLIFYPVLYCLSTNQVYSWSGYNFVGAAVWPYARQLVKDSVEPTAAILAQSGKEPTTTKRPAGE